MLLAIPFLGEKIKLTQKKNKRNRDYIFIKGLFGNLVAANLEGLIMIDLLI